MLSTQLIVVDANQMHSIGLGLVYFFFAKFNDLRLVAMPDNEWSWKDPTEQYKLNISQMDSIFLALFNTFSLRRCEGNQEGHLCTTTEATLNGNCGRKAASTILLKT